MSDKQLEEKNLPKGKPHDSFFKSVMINKIMAIDFFKNFLPERIKERIDLSTIEAHKDSFIDYKLGNAESDALFSVKFDDEMGYLYLICEQQTKPDDFMPLRLYEYVFRIWRMHRKKHPEIKKLPLVFPMVYYNGETAYTAPESLWDLFYDPELAKSILAEKFLTIDIQNIPDEQIELMEFIKLMIYSMKYIRSGSIVQYLKTMEPLFIKLRAMRFIDFESVIFYIVNEAEVTDRTELIETLVKVLSPEDKEKIMNVANSFRQEGRQEGIEEGIARNRLEIAKAMFLAGQDPNLISQFTGISADEIKRLKDDSK